MDDTPDALALELDTLTADLLAALADARLLLAAATAWQEPLEGVA
jgi:hypothetical protein